VSNGFDQAAETVREIYRGVLGREGDPPGISAHAHRLHAGSPLRDLLRDFIASVEFQRREIQLDFARFAAPGEPPQTVHHVVSLGEACYTASILQRWNMRAFSTPFDWLFSTPVMVEHALRDDFATLLDSRQMTAHPPSEEGGRPRCHHQYYGDLSGFGTDKPVFNHHNPLTAEHRGYFERCIGRMRRVLSGNSGSLLVQITSLASETQRGFRSLASWVDRFAPAASLCVVALPAHTAPLTPTGNVWEAAGRHRLLHFQSISGLGPMGFRDSLDELVLMRAITSGFKLDLRAV
jgi:hypothetical protein